MRKLKVATLVTLDGVVQDPGGFGEIQQGGWAGPYFDDEMRQRSLRSLQESDLFLCGRRTYEVFSRSWPKIKGDAYADRMNSLPKLVASTTLTEPLRWNATPINGDVPGQINKLKHGPGKDITMYGSATLMRTLMHHGLVDEYLFSVFPVVLGSGVRLFTDGFDVADFTLVDTKQTSSGVAMLTYHTTNNSCDLPTSPETARAPIDESAVPG